MRTHIWRNSRPNQPWLAGEWEKDWPTETFTQGEGLPYGPLATIGTFHNPHPERSQMVQELQLRLVDVINGTLKIPVDFSQIRREWDGGTGITVRGEVGVFYHRWFAHEPIMCKLEVPAGDGNGLYRVYTWWEAVPVDVRLNENGRYILA